MTDVKNTTQRLGRTENLISNLKSVRVATGTEDLESAMIEGSPLPWEYREGRIISVPLQEAWDEVEREYPNGMPEDDPRWETLPDPTVAFVTRGIDGNGQGDHDARLISLVLSAMPEFVRRLKTLEADHAKHTTHMRTMRSELASSRGALGYMAARTRSTDKG